MEYKYLQDKIKQINVENVIWVIYIIIIFMSWYANYLEKNYFLNIDEESKEKYKNLMVIIFLILLVIYFYFVKDSFDDLKRLKSSDTEEKKKLIMLSFLGSVFVLISGLIFTYVSIKDENLDVELAFN